MMDKEKVTEDLYEKWGWFCFNTTDSQAKELSRNILKQMKDWAHKEVDGVFKDLDDTDPKTWPKMDTFSIFYGIHQIVQATVLEFLEWYLAHAENMTYMKSMPEKDGKLICYWDPWGSSEEKDSVKLNLSDEIEELIMEQEHWEDEETRQTMNIQIANELERLAKSLREGKVCK